ncbi:glycosyltransferase [soil metagenome]
MARKRILIAPLNWGLGHATRCIPIIKALTRSQFEPVIASDGEALELLKKEFPGLEFHTLPGYNIRYAKKRFFFRVQLLFQLPHILKTIKAENKLVQKIVAENNIEGIISDNRWGVISKGIPSVFMTHQVKVLSGITTAITSCIQQHYIKKFDECWLPDIEGVPNLSGKMGQVHHRNLRLKYIGLLSRFELRICHPLYDLAVVLSGPEPQRSLLEEILLRELALFDGKIIFIRGVIGNKPVRSYLKNILIYNFLTSGELNEVLNQSKLVICRPGYTTLMDLSKLEKKAFLIPTPGQYEQEYLGKKLRMEKIAGMCSQKEFDLQKLMETQFYSGFTNLGSGGGFDNIFSLFQGK